MNNGQISSVAGLSVMPLVTQEPAVPTAVLGDNGQQNGGNFAGLLNGIQRLAQGQELPEPEVGEKHGVGVDTARQQVVMNAELAAVNVLELLQASQQAAPAAKSADTVSPHSEKVEVLVTDEPTDRTLMESPLQQALLVVNLQSGRMPDVNTSPSSLVDTSQNVTTAIAQPVVSANLAVSSETEQQQTAPDSTSKPAVVQATPTELPPKAAVTTVEIIPPAVHSAGRLQNAATTAEQTLSPVPAVSTQLTPVEIVPPAAHSADRLQNAVTLVEQAVKTVPIVLQQGEQQTTEPLLKAVLAYSAEQAGQQPEKEVPVARVTPVNVVTTDSARTPVVSPELEVEIQLSQPRPITAQLSAVSVPVGNRPVVPGQQLMTAEPRSETQRMNGEQSPVREINQVPSTSSSNGEALLNSDDSSSSQGQSDAALNNQMFAQDMRSQSNPEHLKVSTAVARQALPESARQDLPEQVTQQVKDRLVQHDLKQGSQQITLTLSPDSLGELKMNLNLQGQKLSVEIVADNRTVRDAIMLHTDALKESLARQNITMESFDVTTGGKGSGSQGQNQNAWRELAKQQQQQQFWSSPRGYNLAQADLPGSQAAYQKQAGQSMLDIHY